MTGSDTKKLARHVKGVNQNSNMLLAILMQSLFHGFAQPLAYPVLVLVMYASSCLVPSLSKWGLSQRWVLFCSSRRRVLSLSANNQVANVLENMRAVLVGLLPEAAIHCNHENQGGGISQIPDSN